MSNFIVACDRCKKSFDGEKSGKYILGMDFCEDCIPHVAQHIKGRLVVLREAPNFNERSIKTLERELKEIS